MGGGHMKKTTQLSFAAILGAIGTMANASVLSFSCITLNDPSGLNCATGESQLSVELLDAGPSRVRFNFYNTGSAASSITDVYYDDGSLLGLAGLIDKDDGVGGLATVDFSQYATPGNLPGGNNISPPFVAIKQFSMDSNPPVQPNGVNPGEWLGVEFDLKNNQTLQDVMNELSNGQLRIGLHVQGFADGGSESYVNNALTVVPLPPSILLISSALIAFGGLARRDRQRFV